MDIANTLIKSFTTYLKDYRLKFGKILFSYATDYLQQQQQQLVDNEGELK
ncbi:MAG: hypothetical protein IPJ51_06380 [Saprospiraceae bacterium]|nr:hypothetical protein [Saprospiraceae bacterium]MBP9196232.1 hypothetical protein [Saprospiraceae bacterium]